MSLILILYTLCTASSSMVFFSCMEQRFVIKKGQTENYKNPQESLVDLGVRLGLNFHVFTLSLNRNVFHSSLLDGVISFLFPSPCPREASYSRRNIGSTVNVLFLGWIACMCEPKPPRGWD